MRFTISRTILTLVVTASLILGTTAFACKKAVLVAFAEDAFVSLKQAQPYITTLLPQKAEQWAKVVASAEKLVAAVKASDKVTAVALLADITPTVQEIVGDLGGNVTVLTILAVADIALHFLVNHISLDPVVVGANPKLVKLVGFKNAEVWGCKYRPDYHPELKYCH